MGNEVRSIHNFTFVQAACAHSDARATGRNKNGITVRRVSSRPRYAAAP